MAFPTVAGVQTSQQTLNTTTSSVTLPANVAAGDLLFAVVAADSGAGAMTWPAGWTELFDAAGSGFQVSAAWAIAAGGETSVSVTHTSERSNHIAARITGWHGSAAPEVSTAATGSSNAPNPGSLAPSWGSDDTLWIALAAWDDSAAPTVSTYPANYADSQTSAITATSAARVALATRQLAATSEDPGAFGLSGTETWNAYTIAVRPAAAQGGGVTGTGASAFGWATAGSGTETITGTAASGFGFATAASGTETVSGTGGSAFGWATDASGTVTAPDSGITGTGASSFGWGTSGSGTESIAGTGASAFGFAISASGSESISGQAASAFSFATSGSGTATSVDSVPGTATASVTNWMVAIATVERSHTATPTVS